MGRRGSRGIRRAKVNRVPMAPIVSSRAAWVRIVMWDLQRDAGAAEGS